MLCGGGVEQKKSRRKNKDAKKILTNSLSSYFWSTFLAISQIRVQQDADYRTFVFQLGCSVIDSSKSFIDFINMQASKEPTSASLVDTIQQYISGSTSPVSLDEIVTNCSEKSSKDEILKGVQLLVTQKKL